MLSTLYSTPTPTTDTFDPATLRRASAHRLSLAPLPISPSMDDYRFGAQSTQSTDGRLSQDSLQQLAMSSLESSRSSSRHRSHRSASSSTRRASLPLLSTTQSGIIHTTHPHPYLPSPRSSTFRHRPSVSSVTTNGTSGSASTSTNDEAIQQPWRDASPELSGIYRDMQSYVFGASSSSQPSPSTSASASTSLHPFAPGPSSLRNVRAVPRHSSSATSTGISVAAAIRQNSLYDDTDMNDLSDAGSAYSPEDDGAFAASQRNSSFAAAMDRMDIDQERKLSRDMSAGLGGSSGRASVRSTEKKRERGNRHSRGPGFSSAALAMTRYDADRSDEISTDEDDSNRTMERSKMRAIDDGSRRPSLPINVHHGPDVPSHNLAQASAAAPSSPTNFRFGEASARLSIPASPTTPTAATFNAMILAAANSSMGAAQQQSQQMTSLQPLSVPSGAFGAMARSVSSPSKGAPLSPLSPASFHTAATSPPESNESPGRDIKTRPRSRSNRAMKPLPSFMANAGIDSNWVPPWSSSPSSDGMAIAKTDSPASNTPASNTEAAARLPGPPPGILPPGTNPFLMSSSIQPRNNPFARRDRSATVTQQSVSGSASPPPFGTARPVTTGGSKQLPSPILTTAPAATATTAVNGPAIVNTSPSPPPEEATDPTADFDLAFILSGAEVATNNSLSPNGPDAANYAARKASLAPSIEDSFIRFVNKFDDEYGERRDRWSYRLERPSLDTDHQGDYWRCENMGRYWVGREPVDDGITSAIDGFTPDNSISIRFCPSAGAFGDKGKGKAVAHARSRSYGSSGDEMGFGLGGSVPPGPLSPTLTPSQRRSNVRVQVKKHNRAPAFTLYLGPRAPRAISASRPSVLLAPKAYHLHTSVPQKGKQPSPIARPSTGGLPTSESLERVASGSLRSQSSQTALLAQARQGFPEYERPPYDAASSSGHGPLNPVLMPLDPPPVSLDLMSVAAATGRMTSVHNQAFDTLSPEDGQVVLEQLKQRSSFRIRISRAFGGGNGSSKDSGVSNGPSHGDDNGRDGRSASPHVTAVGKSHKDHHHHTGRDESHHGHTPGPHEAAFEPPWMLMTPMYVKEAVIAAERSMYTGFASLGLAVQPNKKSKRQAPPPSPIVTPAMRRNSVLDSVPNEAMCMVLPLWDLSLDLEEDKRRRRQVDDLDLDLDDLEEEDEDEQEEDAVDEMLVDEVVDAETLERKRLAREFAKRRKLVPPPRVERKYLLAYYVPFDAKRQSMAASTAPSPPLPTHSNDQRTSKKRPRQGTNAAASRPSLQRRNSGSSATKTIPVKSFRVIARILTPAELRDSGLNPPRNIVDPKRMQQQSTSYFHSSLNYHRMDRRLSSSSIFGDVVPSAFNAVIAVCNDRRRGIEFVPEGLDSLGLCGGETLVGPNGAVEKLPPLFPPAHMVPVKERLTPPLNPVGRQIVEMIWAGCLALTELGI